MRPERPDAWLSKPFEMDALLTSVRGLLGLREEAERRAGGGARPGPSARWVPLGPGLEAAEAPGPGKAAARWVRVARGADAAWPASSQRTGLLVVEGSLQLDGEARSAPGWAYVSPGRPVRLASPTGCLVLALALPA